MAILNLTELEERAKEYCLFEHGNDECFEPDRVQSRRDFIQGAFHAQHKLKPLFIGFARWISEEYSWIDDAWLPKYSDSTTKYITTEELFGLWLEQQTEK